MLYIKGIFPVGSTVAVDLPSTRNSDRLTAFMSEIGAADPIDNYFVRVPTIDMLRAEAKMQDGGRQIWYPIDSGANTTIQKFSDYDEFDTSPQSTALSVVYPMVNYGGSVIISWEELRETAGSDHKLYDLVAFKRKNALNSMLDKLNSECYVSGSAADALESIVDIVDSTGTTGSLSQGTDADWASIETASGSFAAQGLKDMRTMVNDLWENKSKPTTIMSTQTVIEYFEDVIDPDVRYAPSNLAKGERGFTELVFKGVPLKFDADCTSGVMYFINKEHLFLVVDSDANFSFDPFQKPVKQKAQVALLSFRGNIVCNKRKAHGKLTGISA